MSVCRERCRWVSAFGLNPSDDGKTDMAATLEVRDLVKAFAAGRPGILLPVPTGQALFFKAR